MSKDINFSNEICSDSGISIVDSNCTSILNSDCTSGIIYSMPTHTHTHIYPGYWGTEDTDVPRMTTRSDLRDYCNQIEITKEIYEKMEDNIPMGADLLDELIKIGATNDKYVNVLLRKRKLKSIQNDK